MFEPLRIALVGATGLVGKAVIAASVGREDLRLTGIARREAKLPAGARMELFVADPAHWGEVLEAARPQVLICALGTTWNKAGRDEAAFRAVDQALVLDSARAALAAGAKRMVAISSVGAAIGAKQLYLRVKGEVERDLAKLGFDRLDILRPGLLVGPRDHDPRPAERLGQMVAPLANLALHGKYRAYRSIDAQIVARASLSLALKHTRGKYVHDNDAILRAARSLPSVIATSEGKS
ncbi:MAG: NAD(P)H-binding protein [Sphingomonadales bacterium]|nr:NAD(P)H-binding protein [Sphingomonadales bacterium]MBD3772826.1 NAD(P)H-binding protein [Paracoccaceae bacterium]